MHRGNIRSSTKRESSRDVRQIQGDARSADTEQVRENSRRRAVVRGQKEGRGGAEKEDWKGGADIGGGEFRGLKREIQMEGAGRKDTGRGARGKHKDGVEKGRSRG